MATTLRRLGRLSGVLWVAGTALVESLWTRDRGRWLQRTAQRGARVLRLRINVIGAWRRTPLIAANHTGYLDIVALAAVAPVRFVAKAEVRHWPVFGWCARCADTIFLARGERSQLVAVNRALQAAADAGSSVVVFPEATSSDGRQVLPFRSSLFAVAATQPHPVLPVWLGYDQEVAWWGDMTLVPHLWNVLGREEIRVTVRVGHPIWHWDRKELAAQLHEAVCELAHPVNKFGEFSLVRASVVTTADQTPARITE
jgi:1-acyl-sn-glycerol-3-phosphate acyltransferase